MVPVQEEAAPGNPGPLWRKEVFYGMSECSLWGLHEPVHGDWEGRERQMAKFKLLQLEWGVWQVPWPRSFLSLYSILLLNSASQVSPVS